MLLLYGPKALTVDSTFKCMGGPSIPLIDNVFCTDFMAANLFYVFLRSLCNCVIAEVLQKL